MHKDLRKNLENGLKRDTKKDLSPLRRGFLIQGARYFLSGLLLLSLPFLTYARAQTLNFSLGPLDAQLITILIYIAAAAHGVLFTALGLFIVAGGLSYLKRARVLLDSGAARGVLLDLSYRKGKTSLNGGTILAGTLTYDDGTRETLNLAASEKPETVESLIAQPQRVELYGEPFSFPKPRVLLTQCGLLMEQPNELGLAGSIFGFADKDKFLEKRVRGKAIASGIMALVYVLFFSPVSLNLAMFSTGTKPLFSVTILASFIYLLADLIESYKLANAKKNMQVVDCQFTILKNGLAKIFSPRQMTTRIVFSDGRTTQKENLLFEGLQTIADGKPFYGKAYIDAQGKVCGIVHGANALVRSRMAKWALMPLAVYLVSLPFCFSSLQPNKNIDHVYNTAQEYYQQGLIYKAYGWTEKSRKAMLEAQKLGGDAGGKAQNYIKSHLPVKPISAQAEALNIKGFNYMARRNNDEAIITFEECIRLYPEFEWPYANLGSLYVRLGNYDKAAYYLNQAIKINPDYVNAFSHLSDLELKQGHKEAALAYLKRAIEASSYDVSHLQLKYLAIKTSI